jgi:hypothetical protein
MYQDSVDYAIESLKYHNFDKDEYDVPDKRDPLLLILKDIQPELWLPVSIFPRYSYEKESKMKYAFLPFKNERKDEFRELVRDYLRSLDLKTLFTPPPDLVVSVGSHRYNDNGVVRKDHERNQGPLKCGFLYQKFNPKPLETREVWLPDRPTKLNNAYWMLIGRQLLRADPTYPDVDPRVTWENIKTQISDWFGVFDMSGFGFQYPREYLITIAEEILSLYYSLDLKENVDILKLLLTDVQVNMGDGTFKYPPRGIGLGYYEDLKTIGINSILREFKPVSVYGDQGIIQSSTFHSAIKRLKYFEFVFGQNKYFLLRGQVKWSGWGMSEDGPRRPKEYLSPLVSFINAHYHWEKKMILRSVATEFKDMYYKWSKYLPFQYEMLFGYEFQKGDSMWNFSNGGVSVRERHRTGLVKSCRVERLLSPSDIINDSVIYSTPFFTEWKRADAKKFSIKRKSLYKSTSPLTNSFVMEYCNPYVELHNTIKPKLSKLACSVSDSLETKLLVNYGMSTGKFTFGLTGDSISHAVTYNSYARNPFEAYASGGYRVLSVFKRPPLVSSDLLWLSEWIQTSIDPMASYRVEKFDTLNPQREQRYWDVVNAGKPRFPSANNTKRKESHDTLVSLDDNITQSFKKSKYYTVAFDAVQCLDGSYIENIPEVNVCNVKLDIHGRGFTHQVDISDGSSIAEDEDLYLEDIGDLDYS